MRANCSVPQVPLACQYVPYRKNTSEVAWSHRADIRSAHVLAARSPRSMEAVIMNWFKRFASEFGRRLLAAAIEILVEMISGLRRQPPAVAGAA
jgi:hypothetical protein